MRRLDNSDTVSVKVSEFLLNVPAALDSLKPSRFLETT